MGGSSCCRQCGILCWKNARLRLRAWVALLFEILLPPMFTLILVLIRGIIIVTVDQPAYNETVNASLAPRKFVELEEFYSPPTTVLQFLYDSPIFGCTTVPDCTFPFFVNGGSSVYVQCDPNWVQNVSTSLADAIEDRDTQALEPLLAQAAAEFSSLNGTCRQLKTAILPYNATALATDRALRFKSFMQSRFPGLPSDVFVSFNSSDDLDSYFLNENYAVADNMPPVGIAIVFNDVPEGTPDDTVPYSWDYTIRVNGTVLKGGFTEPYFNSPFTERTLEPSERKISKYYKEYWYSGFLTYQRVIDAYIMQSMTGNTSAPLVYPDLYVGPFPTLGVKEDPFWSDINTVFALFMVLSLLVPVANIVKSLVLEKEQRIKAGMLMMSMSRSAFYCSYLATYTVSNFAIALCLTLASATGLFVYSNFVLIFLYYFLFLMAAFSFCFFMSTFFNRARVAQIIGILIWFATYFPYYALTRQDSVFPTAVLQAASLLPVIGFAEASNVFASFESGQIGVQFANLFEPVNAWSFANSLSILMFDTIFYFVLGIYLDQVIHSDNDVSQPVYFCCLPRYWCPSRRRRTPTQAGPKAVTEGRALPLLSQRSGGDDDDDDDDEFPVASVVEPVPETLELQNTQSRNVRIQNLVKSFATTDGRVCCWGGGQKKAVNNLNLDMYEGQVTALLGHNGAGKTTTISILTGLQAMTKGRVTVRGFDVERQLAPIRRLLGVCPQHNILWDNLTVMEHMKVFAALKGVHRNNVRKECEDLIREVGLTEKTNVCSGKLSGGMKRKLSVAIAMLGNSRVVLLDEPTSGMDPWSRRFTWRVIKNNRQGRVIVLTTHFMDEADLLGDRIAIMSHGKLICSGSSLFLKNHYGVGYSMVVVKSSSTVSSAPIKQLVSKHVSVASPPTEAAGEIAFRLPISESARFEALLTDLQTNKAELGVSTIGLGVTTLEEVFTRVGHDAEQPAAPETDKTNYGSSAKEDEGQQDIAKVHADFAETAEIKSVAVPSLDALRVSFCSHVQTMLVKRARYYWRDGRAWCCQVFLPVGILLFGLIMLKFLPSFNEPNLVLDTSAYNPTTFNQLDHNSHNLPLPLPYMAMEGAEVDAIVQALNTSADSIPDGDVNPVRAPYTENHFLTPKADARLEMNQYLARTATPESSAEALDFSCQKDYFGNCSYATKASRYGAYIFYSRPPINKGNISGVVLCNSSSLHAAPIYLNVLSNAQARAQLPSAEHEISITVSNWPFPNTKVEEDLGDTLLSIGVALMTMMSLSFIPASFALFIVREREFKQKHQQNVSGLSLSAYWFSSYLWDFISYLMPFACTLILFTAFNVSSFTKEAETFLSLVLVLGLYGLAVIPFTYVLTFFFKKHTTAWNVIMLIMVVSGVILVLASYIMAVIPDTKDTNSILVYVYRLFPPFCLGESLLNIANLDIFNIILLVNSTKKEPFDMDIAGTNLSYLGGEIVVFYLLTLLLDTLDQRGWTVRSTRCCTACFHKRRLMPSSAGDAGDMEAGADDVDGEDADVLAEAVRVRSDDSRGVDTIRIINARKEYGQKVAVHNLSLGIPNGECFGLLGINGAGKTTTISMLTGEFPPTEGKLLVCEKDVAANPLVVRRLVGYCPQFDALFANLTGREHLLLYGKLKGIPSADLERHVEEILKRVGLEQNGHANKLAGHYSGGNKRKLSVGVAMIGNPKIIFLDEPSTGMDPVARRKMWDIITQITTKQKNCCAVLTTHSMDECEALCSRVGIMVSGRIMCLGSLQHLKERYGKGYQLDVGLRLPSNDDVHRVMQELLTSTGTDSGADKISAIALLRSLQSTATLKQDESLVELFRKLLVTVGATGALSKLESADASAADDEFSALLSALESFLQQPNADTSFHRQEVAASLLEEVQVEKLREFVDRNFLKSEMKERQGLRVQFQVSLENNLPSMFGTMERSKMELGVENYSISQTTLESIFNSFASKQKEETATAPGMQQ